MKSINTVCGQNAKLFNVKRGSAYIDHCPLKLQFSSSVFPKVFQIKYCVFLIPPLLILLSLLSPITVN
jgi:hypothetical protein